MATRPDLLAALGLHGLSHLDAPVLAALATESPMLLIGPHGSAKSALLERLAAALGLAHRHYNASLLSIIHEKQVQGPARYIADEHLPPCGRADGAGAQVCYDAAPITACPHALMGVVT